MKHLYLVRHAKSSWKDTSLADFDRPLNKRGKHDAPLMGSLLSKKGIEINAIYASPANRARSTAIEIANKLGIDPEHIYFEKRIYEASAHELKAVLSEIPNQIDHLLFVGHNPGFTYLAEDLTGDYFGNIPTCGMVGMELYIDDWQAISSGSGSQIFYEYPKKYY